MWFTLFASLVGQAVLLLLGTWLVIWLVMAIPRLRGHQSLAGSFRAAWEMALPLGALLAIVVVGRQLLDSAFQ